MTSDATPKRRHTRNEVLLAMLTPGQGVKAVREMMGGAPSGPVLWGAVFELRNRGCAQQAQDLHAYVAGIFRPPEPRRAPEDGERRPYKVSVQKGVRFVRVPVELVSPEPPAEGEDRVMVAFARGAISILPVHP